MQHSTMGKEIWLSMHLTHLGSDRIDCLFVRLHIHPFMLADVKCHT